MTHRRIYEHSCCGRRFRHTERSGLYFRQREKLLGAGVAEYPLHRKRSDPDYATQSHTDHMNALAVAIRKALEDASVAGSVIRALAIDTTGSSVVPVDAEMQPLGEYYLWCDHRGWREAAEITRKAHEFGLEAIKWCGGVYSSEWGFSKLLHWLRHNPDQRDRFASAFEHCDFVAATLCGIRDVSKVRRSICAMGHKWLWNDSLGGLPSEDFLVSVDPLLTDVRKKLSGDLGPRQDHRHFIARMGQPPRFAGWGTDPNRRLRCSLGRYRRRCEAGRRGERNRHLHVHHRLER